MNLHLMLILLSFHEPQFKEPLELIPAPQVVAPSDLFVDKCSLKQLKEWNRAVKKAKKLNPEAWKNVSYKPFLYIGKDGYWHAVWSEYV